MIQKLTPEEKIILFRSLFRGREDAFAVRWQKADGSASGYTPLCLNEWKKGVCHKIQNGKCRDCNSPHYARLTDHYIEQHLRGMVTIGVYPLLPDNTTHFLAVDFDGSKWTIDATAFWKACKENALPAYIERSRSGNGAHVWLFFQKPHPAFLSRLAAFYLLRKSGIIDPLSKDESFDRIFPNQDFLSGKGFGNLVALPLQGEARRSNNAVFIDPENRCEPFPDQWRSLKEIERIPPTAIESIVQGRYTSVDKNVVKGDVAITLKEGMIVRAVDLPGNTLEFLREKLNFVNLEYLIKKKIGIQTFGMERYFNLIERNGEYLLIPRGFLSQFTSFMKEKDISFTLHDKRLKLAPVDFRSNCNLYPRQREAVDAMIAAENGILVAPPGSGKTIIGIELIARLKQPSLVIVHKKQIFLQWLERIEAILGLARKEIGQIGSGKKNAIEPLTVAMVQTLNRMNDLSDLSARFGLVLVDECHHIPAKTFRRVIGHFAPFYLYGLTATPERKYNDAKLIFAHIGEVIHRISDVRNAAVRENEQEPPEMELFVRDTTLEVPFRITPGNFQILAKLITCDTRRNSLIVKDIGETVDRGGYRCLVLTERKEHIDVLYQYLKRDYETVILTGDLPEKEKKRRMVNIARGDFQVLLATGQMLGEGSDFPNLDSLFLVFPISFSGKLAQYIGRIGRSGNQRALVFDYRDSGVEYLEKLFRKRERFYRKKGLLGSSE